MQKGFQEKMALVNIRLLLARSSSMDNRGHVVASNAVSVRGLTFILGQIGAQMQRLGNGKSVGNSRAMPMAPVECC